MEASTRLAAAAGAYETTFTRYMEDLEGLRQRYEQTMSANNFAIAEWDDDCKRRIAVWNLEQLRRVVNLKMLVSPIDTPQLVEGVHIDLSTEELATVILDEGEVALKDGAGDSVAFNCVFSLRVDGALATARSAC